MKTITLKQRILFAFTGIILFLGVCILALEYYVIKKDIIERAQLRVVSSLESARSFYNDEISNIGYLLGIADLDMPAEALKEKLRLDYFYRIPVEKALESRSEIVLHSARQGIAAGGTRLIGKDELNEMNGTIQKHAYIEIEETPKARPTRKKMLDSVMSKEYALPVYDSEGGMQIAYGGRIINRDFVLVDRIRKLVFGDELYKEKPVGTVTIFQDDVRISTNVLNEQGRGAVGTRVSEEVYHEVIGQGRRWLDRAFVVTDWYKTAYEPIRNIDGKIIGILYVGILEAPYNAMMARALLGFTIVIVLASLLAFFISLLLAGSVLSPVKQLLTATRKMAVGDLGQEVRLSPVYELNQLARSFNDMSIRLNERDLSLKMSNEKLADLNKSYLDLLGFVAHELKGLLSSAVMNAYSLRDGFLGLINFKQKKAVDSICRNLDYLDATVKKFLNLSRIERGNLEINKTDFSLSRDVFDVSIQTFNQLITSRRINVENQIEPKLTVHADQDLMMIVANNLVNNAVKYGTEGGKIRISAADTDGKLTVDVYNDSRPILPEHVNLLFRKFSRLDNPEKKKVKGTGLGLYITRQIVESHGGTIQAISRENGNSFIFSIPKE